MDLDEIQTKIRKIQTKNSFCLDYYMVKTQNIQNLLNPNKKQRNPNNKQGKSKQKSSFFIFWSLPILCLGFPDFSLDFAVFLS
jgi:hypothetical protein